MLNNLQIIGKLKSSVANHLNNDEQLAISAYLADLPEFLSTQEGGAALRIVVDEFFMFVAKKRNLLPKQ